MSKLEELNGGISEAFLVISKHLPLAQALQLDKLRELIINHAKSYANQEVKKACKEQDKEIRKAYIDGTDSCHKAFQPLLKSELIRFDKWCETRPHEDYNLTGTQLVKKFLTEPQD